MTAWPCWWCRSPLSPTTPRRWSSSTWNTASWREKLGVPGYFRAPAQNSDAGFITALAGLVAATRARGPGLCSFAGGRACPASHGDCPMRLAA